MLVPTQALLMLTWLRSQSVQKSASGVAVPDLTVGVANTVLSEDNRDQDRKQERFYAAVYNYRNSNDLRKPVA